MAESNGPRGGGPNQGPRGRGGAGQGARPNRDGKPGGRDGKPAGRGGKPTGRRDDRDDNYRSGSSARGRPAYRGRPEPEERSADQQIYDGPPIPDDISAKDLDKFARQQLQSLPEKLADKVSRHLVMAGLLIQEDPERAYLHALAARARATRSALVREACGETAYAAGKWSEALSEFRASRRMSGNQMYAPMMADCERALKRPEKAIAYDTPEVRAKLDDAGGVELSIVVAGARRDLGQAEAAVRLLETESLHTKGRAPWVARLRYAYADALLDMGRREDAVEWFHRTVAVDGESMTDATDRIAALEG
jgi:tetratricopeptide (TPR) repeat protein